MKRLQAAEARAFEILKTHDLMNPPVDVEALARMYGIAVTYEEFEDEISGVLIRTGDRVRIGVNALHPTSRRRFTIAHELAHFFLHGDQPTVFVDGALMHFRSDPDAIVPNSEQEAEANAFAAALLMPTPQLHRDLRGEAVDFLDDRVIQRLAKRYAVSQQALLIRVMHLGFVGIAASPRI